MTTEEVIQYFGSVKRLSEFLDCYPQTIYKWHREPPLSKQYELFVRTNGELKLSEEINVQTISQG